MLSKDDILYDLKSGKRKIGVWGLGYIGYSTISFYAKNGIKAIGFDIDTEKVKALNAAKINIPNIEYWLGFDVKPLVASGMITATDNWKELISKDIAVHFICVPTEKDAMPFDDALKDIIKRISSYHEIETEFPPLIIIESTIAVDRIDKVVIPELKKTRLRLWKDILLAVAPRRDWFVSAEKSIETIPRIVGGMTPEATELASEILKIVSHTVFPASDCFHAALVKSIENTYRQVGIVLANQLSLAFPDINMREVLSLVGTKWNVDTYHPSFGIGGYCIPLAPHYVLKGATKPEKLTLLKESVKFSTEMPNHLAEVIVRKKIKSVGILGLAYKGDLKVDILSPAKDIANYLKIRGVKVGINDPYYTDKEIESKCGVKPFKFPKDLAMFECVLLVADHSLYRYTTKYDILRNLKKCKYVIDNTGVWKKVSWPKHISYFEAGSRNWLSF